MIQKNRPFWALGILTVAALLTVACEQPGEALTDRKVRENDEEIKAYIAQNNLTATRTEDGIYFVQTKTNPTGQLPQPGDEVKYYFITRRLDGTVVDSSDAAATTPATVNLADEKTVGITQGQYEGILRLRQGEEGAVLVPAHLDRGREGTLLLPQYIPVRYDLRVLSVRTESQQIRDYIRANNLTVTTTTNDSTRIIKTLTQPTDSAAISTGKTVTVSYVAKRLDGVIFENYVGTNTRQFQIGSRQVTLGFENGLTNLRAGEKAIIIIPSALGYTTDGRRLQSGAYAVLPNNPLVYEVTVVKVQ